MPNFKIAKIVNRSRRLHCLPPLTVYPAEAKPRRAPGEHLAVYTMPNGDVAEPVRVYPGISVNIGVLTGTTSRDGEFQPLTETHDEAYWKHVLPRAQKQVDAGDLSFLAETEGLTHDDEQLAAQLGGAASKTGKLPNLLKQSDTQAIAFAHTETDVEVVKTWLAAETRGRVRKVLRDKVQELSGGKAV
jgi:hypothetical protein